MEMTHAPEVIGDFHHDRGYEFRAVTLLTLGGGLVGLDRFIIMPMFPQIAHALGLGFQDIGLVTGALAVAWGISALLFGRLSDLVGRRRVIIGAIFCFSGLVGLSGIAAGLGSLVLLRAMMGLAEGAYMTPSIGATLEAAHPRRRGMVFGFQQMAAPLFGMAICPIFVTLMLEVVDWRWIFVTVAIPGFIVAVLMLMTLRSPLSELSASKPPSLPLRHVATRRNVLLAMIIMLSAQITLVMMGAFLPSYLTGVLGLSTLAMGGVLSACGWGAVAGALLIPALSDAIGRRQALVVSLILCCCASWLLGRTAAVPWALFLELFFVAFGAIAAVTMSVGPIAVEAVPPQAGSTATGLVIAVGEIIGGGFAPVVLGGVADRFGLREMFPIALIGLCGGVLAALFLEGQRERGSSTLRSSIQA